MKSFFAICAALVAASSASAAPVADHSHISAVAVYLDRAVVTRTNAVDVPGPGPLEVAFERLPASLIDASVQVEGHGTAETTLVDVTPRSTYVAFTPNERVKALEDDLRNLARQDRALTDRVTVLGEQREYVRRIQNATTTPPKEGTLAPLAAEGWTNLLTFSADQLGKIATELQSIDVSREDLQARRTALEQQLAELRGEAGRSYKTVTVRLVATTAGQLTLTLRYATTGASWTPSYEARVQTGEHAVQLGYFGQVRQNTGEDWTGVDLTLSTARPSLGGAAPELSPWVVQQREMLPLVGAMSAEGGAQRMAFATLKDKSTNVAAIPALREMAAPAATIETQATSATFHIPAPADVPADNAPHKVAIATVGLKTELSYHTTPKLVAAAFLSAAITNTSEFPLLAGPMNVFLDETFVAASALRNVMPGETFDLALGADEGIAVKRKLNNRFVEDTGLMTKGKRITYDITITVQNHKKTAEKIVVQDQVPVSRHEKIVVRILAPEESVAKPDAEGLLKWALTLAPGEKRELPLKFSVEYPNDLPVSGVD